MEPFDKNNWQANSGLNVNILVGKTLLRCEQADWRGDEAIQFETTDGALFAMYHKQDCCESVGIESIVGDLEDLVGTPILVAEERGSDEPAKDEYDESYTWTFYTFRTIKGSVDIRWYGSSNGYYSESVDFDRVG